MRKAYSIILFSVILLPAHLLIAQSEFEVAKPDLSLNNHGIQIDYQLLNSSLSDTFIVRIEVTDTHGRFIQAQTLSGDVGENIPGGSDKRILWDIEADSIYLNAEIFIEVYAELQAPQVAEILPQVVDTPPKIVDTPPKIVDETVQNVKDTAQNTEVIAMEEKISESGGKSIKRTGIVLQSMLLPGLGLSRVNPGQPHWIKGVVGYGCIAGTLYFNKMAVKSYNEYLASNSSSERDISFNQAERQDVISEVMAFAAIGVWVTDLVWTIVGTSHLNMVQSSVNHKGISLGTSFEPVSSVPMLALRYKF